VYEEAGVGTLIATPVSSTREDRERIMRTLTEIA
jgi:hypothetical protein